VKKVHPAWIFLAIVLIAVILRPPVAQIGPILDQIQKQLGISDSQTALLAAIPVLCFGFGAFASPALVRRFGLNSTMVALLALIVVSVAVRPYVGYLGLLLGTTIAGLSIAVANVLLPSIVRERFPKHVVPLTSAYTTILAASASFAAAFSFPSAAAFGWQLALELWALPALLALIFSFALLGGSGNSVTKDDSDHSGDFRLISRSPIAWSIIGLFGIQSLGFYALLAWLPNLAIDSGTSPSDAGGLLSLMTIVGVPIGLVLSSNFGRFKNLAPVGAVISLVTISGLILLLLHLWIPAVIVIGIGQASSFPLSLSLISTRAANQRLTTMLSSVSQGVGYLVAAAGTFLFGWLAKQTGNWQVSVWGLIALTAVQVVSAWYAGRPQVIK
jgi:CP family cyanate transporter-like MFS transporter